MCNVSVAPFHLRRLLFRRRARAIFRCPDKISARSVSGQFIVIGADGNFAAGRFASRRHQHRFCPARTRAAGRFRRTHQAIALARIGIKPDAPWRGKIFLALHPAQSLDEDVKIVTTPSTGGWSYQVRLPDVLSRARFTRALVSVLLLEFANRNAQSHSAEIPAWLADGLSQQLLSENSSEIILSSPDKIINGLPLNPMVINERGFDPLAGARRVLQKFPALTFEQLSWPTGAQLSGDGRRRLSRQRPVVRQRICSV